MSGVVTSALSDWPVVARFEIRRRTYLSADGKPLAPLPEFALDRHELVSLYRGMLLIRVLDHKAVALQRTGRLGTYAVALGEEAMLVGVASAMRPDDVLFPTYRDNGALMWRGVSPEEILTYWGGDERGSTFAGSPGDFPISIPVGSHATHAAGAAYAFKLRRESRAAVCLIGDGATSKGDVYEAMNFAAIHELPVVFVIANNGWAISVPGRLQSATVTLAQKAIAAGIEACQVDGNDVIAVRVTVAEALARAVAGGGPGCIEALTYRLGDHTTADDARRYRPDDEVQSHWKGEPIARMRNFLVARSAWTKEEEERLLAECRARVETAAETYLALAPRTPASMFDHTYQEQPAALLRQRRQVEEAEHGGDHAR